MEDVLQIVVEHAHPSLQEAMCSFERPYRPETQILIMNDCLASVIRSHILDHRPNEACLLLSGTLVGTSALAELVFPVSNIESPWGFMLANNELGDVAMKSAESNLEVIAFVHSHSGSANPRVLWTA